MATLLTKRLNLWCQLLSRTAAEACLIDYDTPCSVLR